MRWLLVAVLLVMAGPALGTVPELPPPPAPIAVTDEEAARLAADEVVIRSEGSGSSAVTVVVMDFDAPVRRVLEASLDFEARVPAVRSLRGVNTYLHEQGSPERLGVTWEMRVVGRQVVYHVIYALDRDAGWYVFTLDPSREHDMRQVDGSYQFYRVGERTRMVYRTQTDAGISVPDWVRRWLTHGSLVEVMDVIRARAEGG